MDYSDVLESVREAIRTRDQRKATLRLAIERAAEPILALDGVDSIRVGDYKIKRLRCHADGSWPHVRLAGDVLVAESGTPGLRYYAISMQHQEGPTRHGGHVVLEPPIHVLMKIRRALPTAIADALNAISVRLEAEMIEMAE